MIVSRRAMLSDGDHQWICPDSRRGIQAAFEMLSALVKAGC